MYYRPDQKFFQSVADGIAQRSGIDIQQITSVDIDMPTVSKYGRGSGWVNLIDGTKIRVN